MRTLFRFAPLAAALVIAAPAAAEPPGDGAPGPQRFRGWTEPKPTTPCRCRFPGGRVALGSVVCLKRGGAHVLAQCVLVENNTNWKLLDQPCDQPLS